MVAVKVLGMYSSYETENVMDMIILMGVPPFWEKNYLNGIRLETDSQGRLY